MTTPDDTRFVNVDEYVGEPVVPDGVWLGAPTASITIEDAREGGEDSRSPEVIVFTGSDGYEGLTAIPWWQSHGSTTDVRGVIIPDLLPPQPPAAALFGILPAESTTELRLTHPGRAFLVDVTLYERERRYMATADLGEDSRDVGAGNTPQEAVKEALRSLGEPYASEMAESLTG